MKFCWVLIAFFICSGAGVANAFSDDNFGPATKIEGQHFDVYYKQGIDLNALLTQLNVSQADQMLSGQKVNNTSVEKQLSSMLDVLFTRACDVLDMQVYSLKADIKVFATQAELTAFYNNIYHTNLPCTGFAFYLHDFKSIYISAENFKREILGHEMGHAVMSHYFVVQPSVKIQEVLAGYVEYQLRKSK